DPVGNGAPVVRGGQRLPIGGLEGTEDVAAAAATIIDLLAGTLGRAGAGGIRPGPHHLLTRKAFGRLRPHLVQTDGHTAWGRSRIQGRDGPLFCAKSGATSRSRSFFFFIAGGVAGWSAPGSDSMLARSPNQVSCVRQRSPSAISSSSMRLRLIGMPFSSFRYTSRRSSVQHPNGRANCWGLVRAAAMTSPTCSGVYV